MKEYLGDGVYAEIGGAGDIVLTTEDGIRATNTIFLEPLVYRNLVDFVSRAKRKEPQ